MQDTGAQVPATLDEDDARLESLGYRPQLNRVLGLFANFSVAFTYLSPMVGIFSLFVLGLGTGGPAYIWLTWIPVAGMLLVALVFGELASHYPVAGALYQYSKYTVGRRFGWFVGWFYGIALLVTVAAVDTGVVSYVTALAHSWFGWNFNPGSHMTILVVTLVLLAHPDRPEHHRRPGHGPGGAVRRLRRDPRHVRHRGRPRHPRLPPRPGLPDQHAERPARRDQPARPELRRQLDRRRPDRGARAGLHLLRLRVGRGHLRGDQERGPAGAAGHAAGADLGRDRLVRADRRAAAGHAGRRGLGGHDRQQRRRYLTSSASCRTACRTCCWS